MNATRRSAKYQAVLANGGPAFGFPVEYGPSRTGGPLHEGPQRNSSPSYKPGATARDYERDKAQCEYQAALANGGPAFGLRSSIGPSRTGGPLHEGPHWQTR